MRYEKGHKDASKRRIVEVAADRFRTDGIAATGLASIMSDAGLTNGAFYPHFKSKAALIGASVSAALEQQFAQIDDLLAAGGIEEGTPEIPPTGIGEIISFVVKRHQSM
jgi:AcrR family transcriptional regulator